jgi:hypothetical protein
LSGAHEAEAALAIMQLAKPGADVALDSAIVQGMPVTARFAMNMLIHVAPDLFLRFYHNGWSGDIRAKQADSKHGGPAIGSSRAILS